MPTTTVQFADRMAGHAERQRLERRRARGEITAREAAIMRALRLASYAESFPSSYSPAVVEASEALLLEAGVDVLSAAFQTAVDRLLAAELTLTDDQLVDMAAQFARAKRTFETTRLGSTAGDAAEARMERLVARAEAAGRLTAFVAMVTGSAR